MSKLTVLEDILRSWTKADKEAQIEGTKRLGLPDNNTAADRAKAMGFSDNTYYHGATKTFDGFDSTRKSNVPTINGDASRNAISVSPDPDVASVYSGMSPEGNRLRFNVKSNVIPVKTRGKVFDYENPEHLKLLPKKYQPQASTGIWSLMEDTAIQKHIRKQGFDGYQSNELQQPSFVGESGKGQHRFNPLKQKDIDLYNRTLFRDPVKNTQLFDGANIRSPLAHFNPKMAGIGAGSILSADLMANENNKGNMSNTFFDDISKRANERRNLSFEKQKTLLNSGILTPSMTNGSLDGNLTDEQIIEKNAMIEAEEQQAYNDAIALPVGMGEGALGILGDVELLGQGIKGAYNADRGQKWDGFVEGLQDRDTMFWSTLDNQERTDRWLEGTEFGDRLKDGSGGRLVGEILAPIPVPKGIMQAGKIGAKIASHPMTRYAAETAKTELYNFSQSGRGMMDGGMSGMQPINPFKLPQSNMMIGPNSNKFDMPSYDEFKKQIDVDAVMKSRKERNSLLPTKDEQRLWDLTAKKGNPTFIDIDGVIKQEIPTGAMDLKAPLKVKPANILKNESLGSYGLDKNLSIFKMSKAQERLGYDAYIQGDKVGINTSNTPDYLKPRWANDELSTKSHLADKNKVDTFLAHEGQHGIQEREYANNWATGSDINSLYSDGLNKILNRGKKARTLIKKKQSDMPTPIADKAIIRADAAQQMIDKGMMDAGNISKNNTLARRNYFFDRGEIGARTTQGRVNLGKDEIANKHILDSMNEELATLNKNGNLRDIIEEPFSYNDLPDQELLEQFKSGAIRDRSVIDQLNKDELGKMLDDETIKASSTNYRDFVHAEIKKMVKGKKGRKLKPNLKKGNFEYLGVDGKMGHGFEIHFKMDGKKYSVGSKAGTPSDMDWSLDNLMGNLDKHFDKSSPAYMNTALSKVTLRGEGLNPARTSGSMPNPDAKFFDSLDEGVIPKNRQNETTRLIKSPSGTEIEKPLGYRGDPMLDSNWFEEAGFTSSQTPTKDAIKYGANGDEIVSPMNNVLDKNGGITKQPSTGLNSEAMSNMNPMEAARPRGIQGFMELKEELRTLYKEATGDPAMQRQIRDRIVEVDKQMNMFDGDVAKPRKSLYEYGGGQTEEGTDIIKTGEQAVHDTDKSAINNIDQNIRLADGDDTFFTGKYGLPSNMDNISNVNISSGKVKKLAQDIVDNAPVMTTAKNKASIKSINNAINNFRRSPDENINTILREISDLQAQSVPKLKKQREPFLKAREEMLTHAYEGIEVIQRNAYRGTDSAGTSLTKMPNSRLDNISESVSDVSIPKTKPRFDNPDEYEFDQMLRSWDKEAQNIKTRERYLPNGKREDKARDLGWSKKKDNFLEDLEPRTSYSIPPKNKSNSKIDDWVRKDKEAQAEAVKRLGLPANNTAADRAKAMGFGDDVYHGTSHDFNEFNDVTTYVSSSPELATDFAFMDNAGGYALKGVKLTDDMLSNRRVLGGFSKPNIMPLKVRASNTFDYANPNHIDEISPRVGDASIKRIEGGNYEDIEDVIPEIKRKDFDSIRVNESQKAGFDSTIDNLGVFNPNGNIRSKFAHFNPKMAGIGGAGAILSADLMAGEITLEEYKKMLKELQKNKGLLND